jgi:DNA polymerase III alpha subunit (gram-positive type)
MSGLSYFTVDLETTGLVAKNMYHEITEISIIRCSDKMQLFYNIRCEHPHTANIDALRITNKTLADLSKGLSRQEAVAKCNRFFNTDGLTPAHRCIVGHNIFTFDKKFLHALWESVGELFPAHLFLDTIPMTRHYAKQIGLVKPKVNLQAACDIVGIQKVSAKHNAKNDSQNSYLLWKDLIDNKKIDHLPFIKTAVHMPKSSGEDNEALDPELLNQ